MFRMAARVVHCIADVGRRIHGLSAHFQDDVATNLLTIDATDPKSGTAEFKATAICIERLGV